MRTLYVMLGRYGDLMSILPLVLHDYQNGNQPTVMVSKPWADLLDGVGYCDRLVWNGNYGKPMEAKAHAESLGIFDEILVPQPYGQVWPQNSHLRKTGNFCAEAYHLAGSPNLFGNLPLVFDRRNLQREMAYIPKSGKPLVLVCRQGVSHPFPHSDKLIDVLTPLADTHTIVDLSSIKAHRIYDLLSLMEAAQYLVTVDTGILHLARAVPTLPVITLVPGDDSSWDVAPRFQEHIARIYYSEFEARKHEISALIQNQVKPQRRFIHVWSDYHRSDLGAQKRHRMAKLTWEREMKAPDWLDMRMPDEMFERNSRTDFEDNKSAPYVTDMADRAASGASGCDVIVLTNDDTCVTPDLTHTLKSALRENCAVWSARREHRRINRPLTKSELMTGRKHVGADIFVFTVDWWRMYGNQMPDMFMAFENWDYVLRTVIDDNGGCEVEGLCYHEIHTGDWTKRRETPASKHNQRMGGEFFNGRKVAA